MKQPVNLQATLSRLQKQQKKDDFASIKQQIDFKRSQIARLREKQTEKFKRLQVNIQNDQNRQLQPSQRQSKEQTFALSQMESLAKNPKKQGNQHKQKISDSDKSSFEKKFKNYLNHREEFQRKAREKREKIMQIRKAKQQGDYIQIDESQLNLDKEELFSNQGIENMFESAADMLAAYEEIVTGKRRKGDTFLQHAEKFEYLFRKQQFEECLLRELQKRALQNVEQPRQITVIGKTILLDYLFEDPTLMMLYSINPYTLGDQLTEFETQQPGMLSYEEFSNFILMARESVRIDYSHQNIEEAKKIGRGLKCQPILAKWTADTDTLELLLDLYKQVDMLGEKKVPKISLVRKIRKQAKKRNILNLEIIQVLNISKTLTLDRVLYDLEFSEGESITMEEFEKFLTEYKRMQTPPKDKLITQLVMKGKYDSSYIFILKQEVIDLLKSTFDSLEKFAQFFVPKERFIEKIVKNRAFNRVRQQEVRSESNKYVKKQNVEETLIRFLKEAESHVDIEEVLDFFTNRGRPTHTEHQIYLANLELQLQKIEQEDKLKKQKAQSFQEVSSDQQQFSRSVREKRVQRKRSKLAAIRMAQNYEEGKQFAITVPLPFSFGTGVKDKAKTSIREKKLKQMLTQKRKKENLTMIPLKAKQVPAHVKEDLYEKIMKEQERQRKERLQRFRIESKEKMCPVSKRLLEKKKIPKGPEEQKYKFVHKPLPWYCEVNLMERIQREKEERRERILEEVINRHSEYQLPEGTKKMMERQAQTEQRKQRRRIVSMTTACDPECTFQPRITQEIPNFQLIHANWEAQLENKKNEKEPVKPVGFSFQNRKPREKRAQTFYESEKQSRMKKASTSRARKLPQEANQQESIKVPLTEKFQALVQLREKQRRQQEKRKSQEKKSAAIRKMRQQKFAPYVREVLKRTEGYDPARSRALLQERIRQLKKEERQRKIDYENQMINIYTKVFNRPLLVESIGNEPQAQSRINQTGQGYPQQYAQQFGTFDHNPSEGMEEYAENYQLQGNPYINQDESQEHLAQAHLVQQRRRGIQHPPRDYLMQEQEMEGVQYDQEVGGDEYDQEYLSETGRYTN